MNWLQKIAGKWWERDADIKEHLDNAFKATMPLTDAKEWPPQGEIYYSPQHTYEWIDFEDYNTGLSRSQSMRTKKVAFFLLANERMYRLDCTLGIANTEIPSGKVTINYDASPENRRTWLKGHGFIGHLKRVFDAYDVDDTDDRKGPTNHKDFGMIKGEDPLEFVKKIEQVIINDKPKPPDDNEDFMDDPVEPYTPSSFISPEPIYA